MTTFVLTVHISVSIFLIGAVLLQSGKGASIGASFGGGSQTLFGSSSQGSFIGKLTAAVAIIFMITSLALAYLSSSSSSSSIMKDFQPPAVEMPVTSESNEVAPGDAIQEGVFEEAEKAVQQE